MTPRRLLSQIALATLLIAGSAAAGHARTLEEILDRRAFTICVHPEAPPFSVRDPKPGGLQIDLANALAARLGVEMREEWVLFRRDARKVGCDAIMGGVAPDAHADDHRPAAPPGTPMTSRPYAAQLTRVVVRADAGPVASLDDLKGKSIAVLHASFAHYVLDTRGIAVRTKYPTEGEILEAVDNGEMQAGVVSEWELGWYRKNHPDARLREIDGLVVDPDLDYNVAVALRSSDPAFLAKVDEILGNLIADGTVGRVLGDYGIDYRPPMVR